MTSLNYFKNGLALTVLTILGLATLPPVNAVPVSLASSTNLCPRAINMVGWWEFDELVGKTAIDKSGNNNHGTYLNGLLPTKPLNNGVLKFDGTDFVRVPSAPSLNVGNGSFSVCFDIKTSSSGLEVILDKRVEISGTDRGWVVFTYGGTLALQLANEASGFYNFISNIFIADGLWHNVIVTVDRANPAGGKWYVDGKLRETFDPRGRQGDLSNSKPLTMGRRSDSPNPGFFNGSLDDVRIFRRVLLPTEI